MNWYTFHVVNTPQDPYANARVRMEFSQLKVALGGMIEAALFEVINSPPGNVTYYMPGNNFTLDFLHRRSAILCDRPDGALVQTVYGGPEEWPWFFGPWAAT